MTDKPEKAFKKLIVWKRAHVITLVIYRLSEKFPRHEMFGLTSQIRRSSASVGTNIAEGYALGSAPNYLRHLKITTGSLAETEYHIELAHDLAYISDQDYAQLSDLIREAGYLLSRLKPPSNAIRIRNIRNPRHLRHLWLQAIPSTWDVLHIPHDIPPGAAPRSGT
jgi:four helix bundle protein